MEHAIGLHLQKIPDEGRLMRYLFSLNRPIGFFIVPSLLDKELRTGSGELIWNNIHSEDNNYPESAIQILKDNKDNPFLYFIQEGYFHCCEKDFLRAEVNYLKGRGRFPDCYHEHVCVSDGTVQGLFKQKEKVILPGKNLIKKITGIDVKNYCSANHLGNRDTLNAVKQNRIKIYIVRNGFDYLTKDLTRKRIKGLINLPAYISKDSDSKGLVVIPESIIGEGEKSPLISAYYDRLLGDEKMYDSYLEFLDSAVSLSEIAERAGKKTKKHNLSEKLVYGYKKGRDWKGRFF